MTVEGRSTQHPVVETGNALALELEDRFRVIFDAQFSYVWTSLRRLGVSDAEGEDLANEVFFRVYTRLGDYDAARPIRPWLFAFCVRAAADWRRLARHRRELLGEHEEAPSETPAADERLQTLERRALVERALESLDPDKRAVFVLHELDEIPVPEIAAALEIPVNTASSRLRLAREQFRATVQRILRRSP